MAKEYSYSHAKRRCRERYGFEMKRSQYQQLAVMIQNRQGIFVKEDRNRMSVWIVRFKGQDLKVTYDHKKRMITTFLPMDAKPQQV